LIFLQLSGGYVEIYDAEWAANYVKLAEAGIPGREGIYRICRAYFFGLPDDAQFLVVGCGTGEDLLTLARTYTQAHFTALDPAAPMLQVCKARLDAEGFSNRVTLLHCSMQEFQSDKQFDAVSAVLVSQHITPEAEAEHFFKKIAGLLKPGGRLFSADLHIPAGHSRDDLLSLWFQQAVLTSSNPVLAKEVMSHFETDIRPRDQHQIEGFLQRAGFSAIMKPFSSLIYGAWVASKV